MGVEDVDFDDNYNSHDFTDIRKPTFFEKLKEFPARFWFFLKGLTWQTWVKISIVVVIAIAVILCLIFLPWGKWLGDFLDWVQKLGIWGPILLAEAYIACTILFIPGTILTLGAGFAFQSVWIGTVTVSIGSTIGACGAFLYGNTIVRSKIEDKIKTYPIFNAIDLAISTKGWLIVFLLRLSPIIPFNILNYALGLTNIGFFQFAIASWIGMLPATVVYVYIGTVASSIASIVSGDASSGGSWQKTTLLIVGLVATILVLVVVSYYAKKFITKALEDAKLNLDRMDSIETSGNPDYEEEEEYDDLDLTVNTNLVNDLDQQTNFNNQQININNQFL